MILDLSQASYFNQKEGFTNLRIAGNIEYYLNLGFAVRSDMPMLTLILDKAINQISSEKKKEIYSKWINIEISSSVKNRSYIKIILYIVASAIVIILLIIIWNRILQKEVRKQTSNLNEEIIQRKKIEQDLVNYKENLEEIVKERNNELIDKNNQLQQALDEVKKLSGIVPVCANCQKIKNENNEWVMPDVYIQNHSEADLSHTLCPDCAKKLYPKID